MVHYIGEGEALACAPRESGGGAPRIELEVKFGSRTGGGGWHDMTPLVGEKEGREGRVGLVWFAGRHKVYIGSLFF